MAAYTAVSFEEVAGFARERGLVLRELGPVPAGSVNSNYWLSASPRAGGPESRWFLRVYEEQGYEGAAAEAELLAHLAAAAVPTPAPLRAEGGSVVGTVAGKPAALFPWREGQMRCQASVTEADLQQLGAALAAVHVAAAGLPQRGPGRFQLPDLLARTEAIAAEGASPELRAWAAPLATALREVQALRQREVPQGLVHGDLFRDNVLWSPTGELSALLDFESAFGGPLVYDIAVCHLSWCFGGAFAVPLMRALLRGYESVRPLRPAERAGLYDELRFGALRFAVTRITDYAMRPAEGRVMKDYRRFLARRAALEAWGREPFVRDMFDHA